jgi:hypothetical protein
MEVEGLVAYRLVVMTLRIDHDRQMVTREGEGGCDEICYFQDYQETIAIMCPRPSSDFPVASKWQCFV